MTEEDDYDSPWSSWNGQNSSVSGIIAESSNIPSYDSTKSFSANGGDSLTALSSLLELRRQGHSMTFDEFFATKNLKTSSGTSLHSAVNSVQNNAVYTKKDLKNIPEDQAVALIAECFVLKGDLERCRKDLKPADMAECLHRTWSVLQKFSFGYVDENGKLKAVATMVDLVDIERANISSDGLHPHIQNVFPYLNHLTEKVLKEVPEATESGILMEKFMFATDVKCTWSENVILMNMMEVEFHKRARDAGYKASISQNSSPLTQQLAEIMGCKRLLVDKPREYVNPTGERPFAGCAEEACVTVDLKLYDNN